VTDLQSQSVERIEADRKKRERELLLLLLLLTDDAQLHARSAVRLGVDASAALRNVIVGNAALDQPGLADAMVERMVEAYRGGVRRVMRMAGLDADLATSIVEQDERAIRFAYTQYAVNTTQSLYHRIADKVTQALRESWNESINKQVRAIREAMTKAGFTRMNPSALEAYAEAAILQGFNDGLFGGYFSRFVAPRIMGFRHASVDDERTTAICRERDGLTLRRDNPYWLTAWPKLHWGCRSAVLPIFIGQAFSESHWLPAEPPMAGFGAAPAWVSAVASP
jgi:hypothetical protein